MTHRLHDTVLLVVLAVTMLAAGLVMLRAVTSFGG